MRVGFVTLILELRRFVGTLCGQPCANQVKFDASKSSTFVDGGGISHITFSTGVGVDPVVGSNYQLTLRSARDSVTVGGLKSPMVNLFLITDQTPTFAIDPFSGIQGDSYNIYNSGIHSIYKLITHRNEFSSAGVFC